MQKGNERIQSRNERSDNSSFLIPNSTLRSPDSTLRSLRIAVCGELPTACRALREMGISQIDKFDDALNVCFKVRNGEKYYLILVYAPQGEGLNADMPYKIHCENEWQSVPVKLLNGPACSSALVELESIHTIANTE